MKIKVIALFATSFFLSACGKETPKCTSPEVKETVINIARQNLSNSYALSRNFGQSGVVSVSGSTIIPIGSQFNSAFFSSEKDTEGYYQIGGGFINDFDFSLNDIRLLDVNEKIGTNYCSAILEAELDAKGVDAISKTLDEQIVSIKEEIKERYEKGLDALHQYYEVMKKTIEDDGNIEINFIEKLISNRNNRDKYYDSRDLLIDEHFPSWGHWINWSNRRNEEYPYNSIDILSIKIPSYLEESEELSTSLKNKYIKLNDSGFRYDRDSSITFDITGRSTDDLDKVFVIFLKEMQEYVKDDTKKKIEEFENSYVKAKNEWEASYNRVSTYPEINKEKIVNIMKTMGVQGKHSLNYKIERVNDDDFKVSLFR